jgi:hypothetical protein
MPELPPVKRNLCLTKEYLGWTWGLQREVRRLVGQILSEKFEAKPHGILGGVKYCPPEKTTGQLKRKMGRPTKYRHAMTDAERKRRQRGKAVFAARKRGGILPDNPEPPLLPEPWGPFSVWIPPRETLPWQTPGF